MEVTKQQAQSLTKEIQEAVAAILAKHGLADPKVKTTYGDYYKFTLEASPENIGDNGVNMSSKEAVAYTKFHNAYDLPSGLLGKQIVVKGETVTFIGIATTRKKYPYAFRKSDGQTTLYTEAIIPFLTK
jgi:hypothetical protein